MLSVPDWENAACIWVNASHWSFFLFPFFPFFYIWMFVFCRTVLLVWSFCLLVVVELQETQSWASVSPGLGPPCVMFVLLIRVDQAVPAALVDGGDCVIVLSAVVCLCSRSAGTGGFAVLQGVLDKPAYTFSVTASSNAPEIPQSGFWFCLSLFSGFLFVIVKWPEKETLHNL